MFYGHSLGLILHSITVSLYIHYLLKNSLGSSSINGAFYAINWVHKPAGFEAVTPCDKFLIKSIYNRQSFQSRS